jgi:hypothetical protein
LIGNPRHGAGRVTYSGARERRNARAVTAADDGGMSDGLDRHDSWSVSMTDSRRLPGRARQPRMVTCPCRQIPRIPRQQARFRRVCARCELHGGHTEERLAKQNREHVMEWAAFHTETVQAGQAEITRLMEMLAHQAELATLRQNLHDAMHMLTTGPRRPA